MPNQMTNSEEAALQPPSRLRQESRTRNQPSGIRFSPFSSIFAVASIVIKELSRRKDFYVLFILTALITLMVGSAAIFSDERVVRSVKEICLLLIWISALVIAVTTTARQLPAEKENRTIFVLLAKPISRWEVVAGKFLGCWLASGLALFLFYLFLAIVSGWRQDQLFLLQYFQALISHWWMLGIVVALTLLGSVVLTPSANMTIVFLGVIGLLFLGPHLNQFAQAAAGFSGYLIYAVYYVIPHLEFFDLRARLVHQHPPVGWGYWGLALLYGTVYTLFFLAAAWAVFRRKPLV
jgi:ABC-type transport system involved in multi-copper enzyme maturation permease subunit